MNRHFPTPLALITLLSLTACQSHPPIPEPRYIPNVVLNNSEILEIMPYRSACHSATPMQCLLVKKAGASDAEVFGIGYNDIVGFAPNIGMHYKVKVRQEIDQNAGKPTGLWQLEEVLSQNLAHRGH